MNRVGADQFVEADALQHRRVGTPERGEGVDIQGQAVDPLAWLSFGSPTKRTATSALVRTSQALLPAAAAIFDPAEARMRRTPIKLMYLFLVIIPL